MKSYEEITEGLFRRRDECIKQRRERRKKLNKIIISIGAFCLALVVGIGVWQPDFFKEYNIDVPPSEMSETESNDTSTHSQSTVSIDDIQNEIGGGDNWWYYAEYEYNYNESVYSVLDIVVGREKCEEWLNQFWSFNKETYTRFYGESIIVAIEELGITEEQFKAAYQEKGLIVDKRYYIDTAYISSDIDDSNLGRWWYLTEEDVELIFTNNRDLRDRKLKSRYAAFANGKIYTPAWICAHRAEDYIAAGLKKQDLIETVSGWTNVGTPIVRNEETGEIWSDRERFLTMLDQVKTEIGKMS